MSCSRSNIIMKVDKLPFSSPKDQFRKMLKLQSRLGDTELIRPGRDLIREGELQKISRKGEGGPRYFVLLSDCLLYCTYGSSSSPLPTSSSLRVSHRLPLSTLRVRAPPSAEGPYAHEFDVTSPVRSCTLRAATQQVIINGHPEDSYAHNYSILIAETNAFQERNDWLEALNSAIEEHMSRKATFNLGGGSSVMTPDEACKLGNAAPVWVPDRRVTMCQECAVEFGVLVRRHHCRACGRVVCAPCSASRAPLRYRDFEAARVCDGCYDALEKELGQAEKGLRSRFKKRDSSRGGGSGRHVPARFKVSANGGDGAQMCGHLRRARGGAGGGHQHKWKRMWFVLKDRVLYAYGASEDSVASETLPILGYRVDMLSEKSFELYEGESAGLVFALTHPGSGEALVFCAEDDNVCEKWLSALGDAVKLDEEGEDGNKADH